MNNSVFLIIRMIPRVCNAYDASIVQFNAIEKIVNGHEDRRRIDWDEKNNLSSFPVYFIEIS